MSDIKPTRRAALIGAASAAAATILSMPSKASPTRWTADLWEASDAVHEGFLMGTEPSYLDIWDPVDGEALKYGDELAEKWMREDRIPR